MTVLIIYLIAIAISGWVFALWVNDSWYKDSIATIDRWYEYAMSINEDWSETAIRQAEEIDRLRADLEVDE